ncbi:hypothetical protein Clacol_008568 [Clathrus columnatus]|uniref:Protein farnesyltransferase subunit beta n=1 Tax=Clathrus columnatus TaxID=1419009 RepID=A0AAV5ANQ7_9AGAM|nr:hypothetical protein Clacol_008568 [Clathrus columnatus]
MTVTGQSTVASESGNALYLLFRKSQSSTIMNVNLLSEQRVIEDGYRTETSLEQWLVEDSFLEALPSDPSKISVLKRNEHLNYLAKLLLEGLNKRYAVQDASQPWLTFWILQSFSLLGVLLDPGNKQKVINTILAMQHPDGGFGGGPKQAPHILPTYAAICTLAIVGRPGKGGGWDEINRKGLYNFFLSLKQPDGSFHVMRDGEVDIRGTYCLLAVSTMLNILTPTLVEGVPDFVRSCQTYEGGFSCASYARFMEGQLLSFPRPSLGEAHGGYTSCALASWVFLKPFWEGTSTPSIDVKRTIRWLTKQQGGGANMGGFRGRTNKLVDGCYSWWVGGCFALLPALGIQIDSVPRHIDNADDAAHDNDSEWDDVEEELFNSQALQDYIIYLAQAPSGGLRDKPQKSPDAYHTLYNLAGLSIAQHRVRPVPSERDWIPQPGENLILLKEKRILPILSCKDDALDLDPSETADARDARRKRVFTEVYWWKEQESLSQVKGGSINRVNATHPLFNLTVSHIQPMLSYFYGQP